MLDFTATCFILLQYQPQHACFICFLPTTLIGIIIGKYEMMAGKRKKKKKSRCSNDGDFGLRGRRYWRDVYVIQGAQSWTRKPCLVFFFPFSKFCGQFHDVTEWHFNKKNRFCLLPIQFTNILCESWTYIHMALFPIHLTLDCSWNYLNSLLIIFLRNLFVKRHGVTASFHTNEPAGTQTSISALLTCTSEI